MSQENKSKPENDIIIFLENPTTLFSMPCLSFIDSEKAPSLIPVYTPMTGPNITDLKRVLLFLVKVARYVTFLIMSVIEKSKFLP